MDAYRPRVFDRILKVKLESMGCVVIEGPKYCGKTTLARQHAGSVLYMADPDTKEQNITLARTKVRRLLEGDTPRLIDEWQLAPTIWDAVRNEADRRGEDGQFILTGSAVPPDISEMAHTGTGRMSWIKLRTMSLWESGDSTGEVSLRQLFKEAARRKPKPQPKSGRTPQDSTDVDSVFTVAEPDIQYNTRSANAESFVGGSPIIHDPTFDPDEDDIPVPTVDGTSGIDLERLSFLTCRGGWPRATLKKTVRSALMQAREYFDAVTRFDISRVDNVERDPEIAIRLMRSYARHQGSQAGIGTILEDLRANDGQAFNENTIYAYLKALRKIFVIEDMPAWNPNLRSQTAIRTSETHYFTDPSIATAALGLGPKDLLNDLKTFGLIFETLCMRDLRVYTEALGGKVYHYRDKNNLECDAVLHLRNGHYGLVEIKLGGKDAIDKGAASLLTLAGKIDTSRMPEPSFLMVLTGIGDYAYRRDTDGVLVVPVGSLKD